MEALTSKVTKMKRHSSTEARTEINKMAEKLVEQMKVIFDEMAQNGMPLSPAPQRRTCNRYESAPISGSESSIIHKQQSRNSDVVCKHNCRQRSSIPSRSSHKHTSVRSSASENGSVNISSTLTRKHDHVKRHGQLAKKRNYSVCVEGLGDADGIVLCVDLCLKNVPKPDDRRHNGGGKSTKCDDKTVQMRVEMPDFEPSRVIINGVIFQKVE